MVRNEQDIVEPFLAHHAHLFDLMFVIDNLSSDRSREIIRNCVKDFGNVVVTDCYDTGYNQSELMTQAVRDIQAACFADFVFLLDSDEFLSVRTREELSARTMGIPVGGLLKMSWETYVPERPVFGGTDPLVAMKLRRIEERPTYSKIALRLGGEPCPRLVVSQGNHSARNGNTILTAYEVPNLVIYHFPVRSREQLISKSVIGWAANLNRDKNRKQSAPKGAHQWRDGISALLDEESWSDGTQLQKMAALYSQDDRSDWRQNLEETQPPIEITRKYSDGSFAKPLRNISLAFLNAMGVSFDTALTMPQIGGKSVSGIPNSFPTDWHAKRMFVDIPPIKFLAEKYSPSSVLDLGCGTGSYLEFLKTCGVVNVLGVDGMPFIGSVLTKEEYICADLQTPFDVGQTYDLVISLEVAEHLEPGSTNIFLSSIDRHAKDIILFSMAEPGQPGHGHINCIRAKDVLAAWGKLGWWPDINDTLALRALSSLSWFKRNLLVLKRIARSRSECGRQAFRDRKLLL